jgi:hypothetical protein
VFYSFVKSQNFQKIVGRTWPFRTNNEWWWGLSLPVRQTTKRWCLPSRYREKRECQNRRLKLILTCLYETKGIISFLFVRSRQSAKHCAFKFCNVYPNACVDKDLIFHRPSWFSAWLCVGYPNTNVGRFTIIASFSPIFTKVGFPSNSLIVSTHHRDFEMHVRGPVAKFVDSPYYSESELRGGAVTVSFSKYLPWQVIHFL